jgi:hypothetical protein
MILIILRGIEYMILIILRGFELHFEVGKHNHDFSGSKLHFDYSKFRSLLVGLLTKLKVRSCDACII